MIDGNELNVRFININWDAGEIFQYQQIACRVELN